MTIDIRRSQLLPDGKHACDHLAADLEELFKRSDIRFDVTLALELVRPHAVSIVYIKTLHKRRGKASFVMNELVSCADRHDVTLDLDATAVQETGPRIPGLSQQALVAFYLRRGFVIIRRKEHGVSMRRLAPSFRKNLHEP